MNLLDFFKRKEHRRRLEKSSARSKTDAPQNAGENKVSVEPNPVLKLGESVSAAAVLRKPHITEKSSILQEKGVYIFQVSERSSKYEIKKAVEELYGVKVSGVKTINVPSRLRHVGRKVGRRPGYKKAVVRMYRGQKIEFI